MRQYMIFGASQLDRLIEAALADDERTPEERIDEETRKMCREISEKMMTERITMDKLEKELANFTGTLQWYKDITGIVYTDGIRHVAQRAGAYWLITHVGSLQHKFKDVPFQLWRLEVEGTKGRLTMREDSNRPFLHDEEIAYTDFPEGAFEFYEIDGVMLLKSEY